MIKSAARLGERGNLCSHPFQAHVNGLDGLNLGIYGVRMKHGWGRLDAKQIEVW